MVDEEADGWLALLPANRWIDMSKGKEREGKRELEIEELAKHLHTMDTYTTTHKQSHFLLIIFVQHERARKLAA